MSAFQLCNITEDCIIERSDNSKVALWCFQKRGEIDGIRVNECDCFTYFGYQGEFCQEPTIQTFLVGILHLSMIISSLIGVAYIYKLSKRLLKVRRKLKKQELSSSPGLNKNTTLLCWALWHIFLSFLFELMFSTSNLVMVFDQKFLIHVQFRSIVGRREGFTTISGPTDVFAQGLTFYFFMLTCLNMNFFWLHVIQTPLLVVDYEMYTLIERYKQLIIIMITIVTSFALILAVLNYYQSLATCSFMVALPAVVFTLISRVLFIRGLRVAEKTNDEYLQAVIDKIKSYSFILGLTLLISGIGVTLYGFFAFDIVLESTPGDFITAMIPMYIVYLVKLCASFYTLNFIDGLIANLEKIKVGVSV